MWVRNPDADRFTLRLNDASGQTHQIVIKTEPGPDWQKVVLPLERFFARRGQADAVTNVVQLRIVGRGQGRQLARPGHRDLRHRRQGRGREGPHASG